MVVLLDEVDKFLKNNQALPLEQLDGFLVAVISSPNYISFWGWTRVANIKSINYAHIEIIMKFYNKVYDGLRKGSYVPVFDKMVQTTSKLQAAINWAKGYMVGKNLWDPDIVNLYALEVDILLLQIIDLAKQSSGFIYHKPCYSSIQLSKICLEIYRFWVEKSGFAVQKVNY